MTTAPRRAALAALALALAVAGRSSADPAPSPLGRRDLALYERAVEALRAGDDHDFSAALRKVRDTSLVGRLTYLRLMSPDHHATFEEARRWLSVHGAEPGADKVYALARKRRLEDPALADAGLPKPKSPLSADGQAAREAYYLQGDAGAAFDLASRSGDRWILGLAAFRLSRFEAAFRSFSSLARDANEAEQTRLAAAFWAARAAVASGSPKEAPAFLRIAARRPKSFYGLLAERQLGLDPAPPEAPAADGPLPGAAAPETPEVRRKSLLRFVKTDPRAHRAAGLAQLGLQADAVDELRTALSGDGSPVRRPLWLALADALDVPLRLAAPTRGAAPSSSYPAPDLTPLGGFTLDRALVWAVVRQESSFNPNALSPAGAYGLMQLTPATAALDAGLDQDGLDSSLLMDPETNLRLGQDHLGRLLRESNGDLVRAIAAYNAGVRPVDRTLSQLPDADAVTLVESLPASETRAYVQKVLADYWIYRRLFGQPAASLDAVASGARTAPADPPPPPAVVADGADRMTVGAAEATASGASGAR